MVKLYTPVPSRYGVIRIDPIATASGLPYPEILDAAKEIAPKKHLVYIVTNVGLAWPNEPWFLFDVIPIAPCLPPDDGTTTPEMCVPVFPNTSHPSGRMNIRTNPEFPYNNCYHWSHARQVTVRIRAKPEKFNDDRATKLEPRELLTFWELSGPDRTCEELPSEEGQSAHGSDSESFRSRAMEPAMNTPATQGKLQGSPQEQQLNDRPATPTALGESRESRHPTNGEAGWNTTEGPGSPSIRSFESTSERSAMAEFRAIVQTGIFGDPYEDKQVYPLVDLWVELADNLKQDDIQSPEEFYKEYDTVVSLVTKATMRREQEERIEAIKRQADKGGDVDDAHDEPQDLEKGEPMSQNKRKYCLPKKAIENFRARAMRMFALITHTLRLPYVPMWP